MRPQLSVTPADQLTPAERTEIVRLCSAAFAEDLSNLFDLLPGSTHVLVRNRQELVGHACWVTRWLQPADLPPLRTAYVEAVATNPSRQGRGIGRAVMQRLGEEITGYDLGALSPAVEEFYERLGWEMWRGPTAIRMEDTVVSTPGEEVMILRTPRTPPLDLDGSISAEWRQGELW